MIPEAGTRSELKAALVEVCLFPVVGEVYDVRDFPLAKKQKRWRVESISHEELGEITVAEIRQNEHPMLYDASPRAVITFNDWQNCIQDRYLKYVEYDP